MSLRCWFSQCDWRYLGIVSRYLPPTERGGAMARRYEPAGIYQCARCKTVSIGSPTDPKHR